MNITIAVERVALTFAIIGTADLWLSRARATSWNEAQPVINYSRWAPVVLLPVFLAAVAFKWGMKRSGRRI